MLIAAIVIGFAYNAVTPLGVVFGSSKPSPSDSKAEPAVRSGGDDAFHILKISWQSDADFRNQPMLLAKASGHKNLTWEQTQQLLAANEIVLVDARNAVDYQTEHIPGAVSLPAASTDADLANFTSKYSRDTALVIYCESKLCPMSRELSRRLHSQGYKNIRLMPGGFAEYRASRAATQH